MSKKIYPKPNVRKGPADAPQSVVIQKIDVMPQPRRDFDIPLYKDAIKSAESRIPRRSYLYDLYSDVELDDQVEADTAKLIDAVTGANWSFVDKDGKEVDVVNKLLDTIGFERLLREIVKSKFWGYSMLEPKFYKNSEGEYEMTTYLVPRPNMRPELGVIAFDHVTDEGINIREGVYAKTIMEVGEVDDLGTYLKAAPYRILKRGAFGDYAMFVQIFGEPIIDAVYDGLDETSRAKLQTALNSRGPGGAIVRPQGTNVTLLANSNNATGALQDTFIANCNKGISKALLGTTETSDSSSSSGYAQSKTHESQNERRQESLLDFVRRILNSRFKPILAAAGIEVAGGQFVIEGEDNELSKKDSFEIHMKMAKELGIPIADDFFYENYGVSKPDNYDQLKKTQNSQLETEDSKLETRNSKLETPKEEEDEVKLSSRLVQLFRDFFGLAPAQIGATTKAHTNKEGAVIASESEAIQLNFSPLEGGEGGVGLLRRIADSRGTLPVDYDLFEATFKTLFTAFKTGLAAQNSQLVKLAEGDGLPPNLLTAYELNLFRFSAAKSLVEVQELNALFRQAGSFAEFERLAAPVVEKYNRIWLQTEYTTAQRVGEAAATYNRLVQQADLFPYWEYRTVGDEHVRKEHANLYGVILPWNDPRWDQIYPPNGWNCRCFVLPRMAGELPAGYNLAANQQRVDAYFTTREWLMGVAQGWGVNRGKIGEIFTANQQYVYKQPGMAARKINELQAADYKLPSYSQMKKRTSQTLPEGTENPPLEGAGGGYDYGARPVTLPPAGLGGPNYLRQSMLQALAKPDEVWLHGTGSTLDELVYVRYYADRAIVVQADYSQGTGMVVKNWQLLQESDEQIRSVRRGILIEKR